MASPSEKRWHIVGHVLLILALWWTLQSPHGFSSCSGGVSLAQQTKPSIHSRGKQFYSII